MNTNLGTAHGGKRLAHLRFTLLCSALVLGVSGACGDESRAGFCDETAPCPTGFVCNLNDALCNPTVGECSDSSDCSIATGEYCVGPIGATQCSSDCEGDTSCVGVGDGLRPYCAPFGGCVACIPTSDSSMENDNCSGRVCDATDYTCRDCELGSECDSGICGTSGSCKSEEEVDYVAATSTKQYSENQCTRENPCGLRTTLFGVRDGATIGLLDNGSPIYRVPPLRITKNLLMTGIGENIVIDSSGLGAGAVITVASDGDVTIANVAVANGDAGGIYCGDQGILHLLRVAVTNNQGHGVQSGPGCYTQVYKSHVQNNGGSGIVSADTVWVTASWISGNQQVGIDVANGGGVFPTRIHSNFIVENGSDESEYGGLRFAGLAGSTIAFNTIANNHAQPGNAAGISCMGIEMFAENNIVYGNSSLQIDGDCNYYYADIGPEQTNVLPSWRGIINTAPDYVSSTDYHLQSPLETGVPLPYVFADYDGDLRSADFPDLGADEYIGPCELTSCSD